MTEKTWKQHLKILCIPYFFSTKLDQECSKLNIWMPRIFKNRKVTEEIRKNSLTLLPLKPVFCLYPFSFHHLSLPSLTLSFFLLPEKEIKQYMRIKYDQYCTSKGIANRTTFGDFLILYLHFIENVYVCRSWNKNTFFLQT